MKRTEFQKLAEDRVLLLDGAAGSNFLKAGMPAGVCSELWLPEHPDVLLQLQRAYVEAGAQILYAPTFGGNRAMLEEKHVELSVKEINSRIVALSKEAADGKALIAGDMTMTGKQLVPNGTLSAHEALEIYREQAQALYEGGVDLFVVETMVSLQEMRMAVLAIREVCDLPILCTFTVDGNGFTFLGTEITAAGLTLESMGVDAVGLNCSMGPDQMELAVKKLKKVLHIPVIAKANAGHPQQEKGQTVYKMEAGTYVTHAEKLVDAGVGLIGGCCGTTPEYIKGLRGLLEKKGRYIPLTETASAKTAETGEEDHSYEGCLTTARSIFAGEEALSVSYAGCVEQNKELYTCLAEGEYEDLTDALEDALDEDMLLLDIDAVPLQVEQAVEPLMGVIAGMNLPLCLRTNREDILKEALLCYSGRLGIWPTSLTEKPETKTMLSRYGAVLMD